jgi:hypothetical protein
MTNQSPSEPPNSMPERRRRPATGVTFDEMIAIIVAFSTIGTILFWAMGGRNSKLADNLGLGNGSSLLTSSATQGADGDVLSKDKNALLSRNRDLEAENRQLAAKLQAQETPVGYIPPNQKVNLPPKVAQKTLTLDSGARLVPLAGLAALPGLNKDTNNEPLLGEINSSPEIPEDAEVEAIITPETGAKPPKIAPVPTAPAKVEPEKPVAITPEKTQMPQDVVPDYWAYPFVKQMRDQGLVPELAKNQEFDPDGLITRASMATLVSQAFDQQPKNESIKQFNDVSNNNEIAKDIDKAVSSGFMQGYSDNEFKPLENIPRYQVLVTLATGLGLKPSQDAEQILQQFDDSSQMPDWAKQQVAAATEAGLVVNPPDTVKGSLVPERPATRGEVAAMIHQALVKTGKLKPLDSEYLVKP